MAKDEIRQEKTRGGQVELMFRQNRSFELTVGGQVFFFTAGSRLTVDRKILDHQDFKQQADLFSVREV